MNRSQDELALASAGSAPPSSVDPTSGNGDTPSQVNRSLPPPIPGSSQGSSTDSSAASSAASKVDDPHGSHESIQPVVNPLGSLVDGASTYSRMHQQAPAVAGAPGPAIGAADGTSASAAVVLGDNAAPHATGAAAEVWAAGQAVAEASQQELQAAVQRRLQQQNAEFQQNSAALLAQVQTMQATVLQQVRQDLLGLRSSLQGASGLYASLSKTSILGVFGDLSACLKVKL